VGGLRLCDRGRDHTNGFVLTETSPPATPAIAKPPIELTCATEPSSITLSSPGVLAAAAATEHKNWQPVGGQITFTIHSSTAFDANAQILACLGWKTDGVNKNYETAKIIGIDLSASDKKTVKLQSLCHR